jgi:hypothetical protein
MSRIGIGTTVLVWTAAIYAQTTAPSRFVGTVTEIKVDTAEIVVKPNNSAEPVAAKLTSDTLTQRVEPGAKDLKGVQPMNGSDISVGDQVLVDLLPNSTVLRRIVVMSAKDIAKKNTADQADWTKRGVSGVVAAKNGNDITLKMRSITGEIRATVTVADKTVYRRYAPDSVKFAEAKISKLDEVNVGDQLRARGQKSDDGSKVAAEEVVFGTFVTKAGAVTAVNPETREVTIKELGSNASLVVKMAADSQLKRMPSFGGGAPGGGGPPAGAPGGAPGGGPGMMMRPGGGAPPDITQMIEHMPPGKIEDIKPGETIVVSSTKGAKSDQLTAITLLSNADGLIRMLTMAASAGRGAGMGGGSGPSLSGLAGGLDGLNLGINP